MSIPDDEFDVVSKEELAFLSRRFDRLHENWRNARQSKGKKNAIRNLSGTSCVALGGFCSMAQSSSSKNSEKKDTDSD
jgi:hypothetical protein